MRIMRRNQTSQGFVNQSANDEKPELPVGKTRAVRLRGLLFPTRVGSPRRASALRNAFRVVILRAVVFSERARETTRFPRWFRNSLERSFAVI